MRTMLSLLLASSVATTACGGETTTTAPAASRAASPPPTTASPNLSHTPLAPDAIQALLAAPDRTDADRKTDIQRHAPELLAFMGVGPGMVVADLGAGGGYTTELLVRAVGPSGKVYTRMWLRGRPLDAHAPRAGRRPPVPLAPRGIIGPDDLTLSARLV